MIATESQPYGFTGREFDAESGLHYFRARHLDTGLGQFVQRDPIGFAAGDWNLYAYVWNDPYQWSDPSGLAVRAEFQKLTMGSAVVASVTSAILKISTITMAAILATEIIDNISRSVPSDDGNDSSAGSGSSGSNGGGCGPGSDILTKAIKAIRENASDLLTMLFLVVSPGNSDLRDVFEDVGEKRIEALERERKRRGNDDDCR